MPFIRKGSCLRIMHAIKEAGGGEGLKEEWIATSKLACSFSEER